MVVMVITSFTVEEEDADSPAPIHVERKRKSIVCKSAQDCSGGSLNAAPPQHTSKKRKGFRRRQKLQPERLIGHIINKLLLL